MTARRALFWGLLLALLACGTSGRASSAVAGVEGQEGPHRALLDSPSTAGVPPPPFQVVITCDQPGPTTSSPLPLWTVDFGRPLQQANPLSLFRVAGVYRVDVVYQPGQGLLYVLGFVAARDQPTTLQLTIPAGAATAAADGAPNAEAAASLAYQPVQSASGLSWLGTASSAAFGGTMALSFATGLMGGAGGVGMGALGFAGYAQTFYYSGSLPLSNMPENYKTVSGSFGWATLSTLPSVGTAAPAPPPGQMSQAEDTLYSKQRFPFPPIVVIPQQQPGGNASDGGGDSGGDGISGGGEDGSPPGSQPSDVVVWPIGSLEDQMGSPGGGSDTGSVFDGPLPSDGSTDEPAPAPPPAASAGAPGTPPGGSAPAASGPGTPPGQQGQPGQPGQQVPSPPPPQNNPFDPNQVDDPAFQNPPPEPDLPPSEQGGSVPSPPQAGGTPSGTPGTGQPSGTPAQGSPPGATPLPGSPPGATPVPGGPPGATPVPGGPPGSTPVPGGPPGSTPVPGGPPGSTPVPGSPPGATPVPGSPPGSTPVPGAPPGGNTPVPGLPPGQGSSPGAPPASGSPPGQAPVPGRPPARSPPGNRTLPPSALSPPAGGPSIIPPHPPPSGVGGQGDPEGPPMSDNPGPPGTPNFVLPPLPPSRTLPRAKRPPPPGPSSPQGAAPPSPPAKGFTPPGASTPPLPGLPAPPGVVIKPPAPPGTVGTQTGGDGPVFDDPNYNPDYHFPPFPPNPPPRPPRPPPRPPRTPPRPPRPPPSPPSPPSPPPSPPSPPSPPLPPPSPPLPPPSPPTDEGHALVPAPAPGPGDPWDFEAPAPAPEEQAQPEAAPQLAPPSQPGEPAAAPSPGALPGKPGIPPLPLPDASAPAPAPMIDGAPSLAPEPSVDVLTTPPPPSPSAPPPQSEPSPSLPPPSPSPPPPSPSPPPPEPVAVSPPPSPSPPPPSEPSPPPLEPSPPPPLEPSPPPPLEPSPPPPKHHPPPLEPSPPPPELSPPPLEPSPPPPERSPPPLEPSPPPPERSPPPLEPSPPPPERSPPPLEPSPPPPERSPPPKPKPSPSPPPPERSPSPPPKEEPSAPGPEPGGGQHLRNQGFVRRRLTAAEARRLIQDPLSSLTSSGFYVVTTVTVSDVVNGTASGQPENVSDASVGASALSRIRAIQSAAGSESAADQNMQILWNVLFWSAVVIGGFALVHLAFVLLLRWRGKSTPKMLHMPRLELLLFMMVLPMVVAASATLLRGPGAVHVAVGVIFAVLLPLAFLGTALGFVVHYLVRNSVEKRRAVFVLQLPPGVAASGGGDAAAAPAGAPGSSAVTPRRGQGQHEQPQGRPEMLGRNSLTEQFLSSQENSFRAGAGSGATFVTASSLPDPSGPFELDGPSGQFITDQQSGLEQRADGRAEPVAAHPPPAEQRGPLRRAGYVVQRWLFRPLFGFELVNASAAAQQQPSVASIPVGTAADGGVVVGQGAWLCKSKWDTTFVKRYGSLFEDARGPQVYHITSVYESDEGAEPHVGTGVLVPASYTWSDTTVQTLQTFGILLSVAKMVLFALIINAVGSVNSIPQVLALVLVALLHLVYLRLCLPFRMRIELAAEMVASCCDLGVFVCGIILVVKTSWTTAERRSMGLAMLVMQATGFLIFISVRVLLAGRTIVLTVAPMLGGLVRRGSSAQPGS